jgi:hypothetical protein
MKIKTTIIIQIHYDFLEYLIDLFLIKVKMNILKVNFLHFDF